MFLDSTAKSLEVILGGAVTTNELIWTSHFVNLDSNFAITTVSENDGLTNGTTAVTIISAPSAGNVRQVKYVSVFNNDTVAATVTIRINNGGTFRTIVKTSLSVDKALEYTQDNGWKVF